MKELYWIERLDNIQGVLMLLAVMAAVWLFVTFAVAQIEDYDKKDLIEKGFYKARKIASALLAISVLILTFLPSTKEMYRIIGIGGTIDYLRQNDTAKQLPDKCIKALDTFIDKVIEEDNTNK